MKIGSSMPGARTHRRVRQVITMAGIAALGACGADSVVGVKADGVSRTISASAGQEIAVLLGNVGPAMYAAPPAISSGAVTFLGVEIVPPYNPGGPTQRFRLRAASAGQAVVTFRRMLGDSLVSVVEDTVQVR